MLGQFGPKCILAEILVCRKLHDIVRLYAYVCSERNVFSAYCILAHLPNEVMSTTEPANGVCFGRVKNTKQRILETQDLKDPKVFYFS